MSIGLGIFLSSLFLGFVAIYLFSKKSQLKLSKIDNINIIKGIDRIALVLAIVALLVGFFIGLDEYDDSFLTHNPEYTTYEINKNSDPFSVVPPFFLPRTPKQTVAYFSASAALGAFMFLAVLFGVRWGSRGTKWLLLWIAEGFKDKKP